MASGYEKAECGWYDEPGPIAAWFDRNLTWIAIVYSIMFWGLTVVLPLYQLVKGAF